MTVKLPPPENLHDEVRAVIRNLMTEQRISQVELCRRIHMTPKHVSQVLTGQVRLSLELAETMLSALGHRMQVHAVSLDTAKPAPAAPVEHPGPRYHWVESTDPVDVAEAAAAGLSPRYLVPGCGSVQDNPGADCTCDTLTTQLRGAEWRRKRAQWKVAKPSGQLSAWVEAARLLNYGLFGVMPPVRDTEPELLVSIPEYAVRRTEKKAA